MINYKVIGEHKLQDHLQEMKVETKDTRKLLARCGVQILRWVDQNFRAQGLEKSWKPLAESTKFVRRGKQARILQNTGILKQSFTSKVETDQVKIGSPLKIAGYHHFGGEESYIIRPKSAKALFIPSEKGLVVLGAKAKKSAKFGRRKGITGIFRTKVVHPPLPARPILPGDRVQTEIVNKVVTSYLGEINKGSNT